MGIYVLVGWVLELVIVFMRFLKINVLVLLSIFSCFLGSIGLGKLCYSVKIKLFFVRGDIEVFLEVFLFIGYFFFV